MTLREPRNDGERNSDAMLMSWVQNGDSAAFAEIYDRHVACALRIARRICSSPNQAEDSVQEGFLSACRNRATYRSEAARAGPGC